MKLTKNEKKTLKLLLENAKMTDTEIGGKLKITKQAAGKIRRKLEKQEVVKGYGAKLDYEKLGVTTFAIATIKLSSEGIKKHSHAKIEGSLIECPQVINAYKLSEGFSTYFVLYGFRNLTELDKYFKPHHCLVCGEPNHSCCIDSQGVQIFSSGNMIKDNSNKLLHKTIDEFGNGY